MNKNWDPNWGTIESNPEMWVRFLLEVKTVERIPKKTYKTWDLYI